MRNSKKMALAYLESLGDFGERIFFDLSLKADDLKFVEKRCSNSTKSRYYAFVTKDKHSHTGVASGSDKVYKEFIALIVRISDHPDYMNGCEWDDEEFEGKVLSINELETGESAEEALENLDYFPSLI